MVGLCAAETQNPRKTLPSAVKQVFWRICLFYMFSLTIVGVVVPYDNDELLNGTGSSDANASPFVIAVRSAGIQAVPSIMNVVILISVLSVGNTSVYASSRTLAALADRGQAPKILATSIAPVDPFLQSVSLHVGVFSATSSPQDPTRKPKLSTG